MNALVNEFKGNIETIKSWRHHLHKHPELSLEEAQTAKYIADLVRSWGYEVVEGVGKYGVVASLTAGNGKKSIGFRADTDALPIQEDNDLPYKSDVPGVAHLCGHDGHSTMLLAAGEYLARTRNFNGTVRLIFQPAEEIMAGGPAMIEDGLFERWPVDAVFGMHNMPGLELGKLHFRDGAMMAAVDNWEIELIGKGSHGSMPELSIDPVVAGSSLVTGAADDRVAQRLAAATAPSSPWARSSQAMPGTSSRSRRSCVCRFARPRRTIARWCWARYDRSRTRKRRRSAAPTTSGKASLGRSLSTSRPRPRKLRRSRARRSATTQ